MKKYITLIFLFTVLACTQAFALSGGPDAYGYIWRDSYELNGPTPMWVDTNSNWVQVAGLADDNSTGPFAMNWNFHYYWGDFSTFKVGSNGWISFDNVSNIAHCFPTIPTPGGVGDNFVAPLMSDLNFSSSFPAFPNVGEVWYYSNFKDTLIVTYYQVPWWQTGTPDWFGSNTFQVLFDGRDSSITFTYQTMNASFNDMAGCAGDVILGIENGTGNVGLQCWNDSLPGNNYAIKFSYPPVPLLSVKDLTPLWNQNVDNGGEFYPLGLIPSLNSKIKSVGNDDIVTTSTISGSFETLLSVPVYTGSHTIPSLLAGQDTLIVFSPQANVPTAGQYYWEVTATNANDINPGNNVTVSEVNMVDLSGPTATLTYATGAAPNGSLGWNGGQLDDGMGVYMKPPVYPMDIASLRYYVNSTTADGFIAGIFDDNGPNGGPGTLLFTDTIPYLSTISGGWNTVTLSNPVTISNGGFYVAFFMGGPSIFLSTETAGPKSFRSYEILSGQWSEYRENTLRDYLIEVNITNYPCAITAAFSSQSSATTVNFTNLSTGGTTYAWDFGDGNSSTATSPQHIYSSTGTFITCLIATNACGADTTCDTLLVSCPPPSAGYTFSSTGISVQFSDNTNGFVSSWNWDFGDGNSSTMQNPLHSYGAPGTYTVCLISSGSCGADTTCQSVAVCALPVSNWLPTSNGLTTTFANFSSGGTSYSWDFGDGNTSTTMSPYHSYAAGGAYLVCLITTNACDADTNCQTVSVCPAPASAFSSNQNQLAINFTDNTTGSPSSWFWDFGDGNTSTMQSPTHTYSTQDTFTVCLITTNTCGNDTTCIDISTVLVGLNGGLPGFEMNFWPNPSSGEVRVKVEIPAAMSLELSLTDLAGKTIQTFTESDVNGQWNKVLDVSALSSGMYFLEIRAGDFSITRKLVRE